MTPTADIIRQLLLDLNLGAASGPWTIFTGFLPKDPDSAICVYDTTGTTDGRLMVDGHRIEHPGIMIYVRSRVYPIARNKAEEIALALDAQRQTIVDLSSVNSYTIHNISRTGAVNPLGMDEGDRPRFLFSINAITTIHKD